MKKNLLPLLSLATIFLGTQALAADATGNVPSQPTSASKGQPGNSAGAQGKKDTGTAQPLTTEDENSAFGTGPSNPKVGGPWSGKRAGKNQAGAGGYNQNVVNPGGMIPPLPRDDQHDTTSAVPAEQATKNQSSNQKAETTRRKGPEVGTGSSAANARLDPVTGKRVLPDTEASSNPANPNAPESPGTLSTRAPKVFDRVGGGAQNSGAFADMSLNAPGGTPRDEMERSRALELAFAPGTAELTPEAQASIDGLLADSRAKGKIDKVKVLAWADTEAAEKKKLPDDQVELAAKRTKAIEQFVEEKVSDIDVDAMNMAKPMGAISKFVNPSDKRLLDQLNRSGLTRGNASRAMVMVIMKR